MSRTDVDRSVRIFALLAIVCIPLLLGVPAVTADQQSTSEESIELLVYLDPIDPNTLEEASDPVAELKAHAERTQAPLVEELYAKPGVLDTNGLWLVNAIVVTVDPTVIDPASLESLDTVTTVTPERTVLAAEPATTQRTQSATHTDGLEQVNVPDVWDSFDTRGAGVSVAVLDTGVDADHPDISVADWRDFGANPSDTPLDYGQHGTHVSGTVTGGNHSGTAIGVAPDADLFHGAVLTDCDPRCSGSVSTVVEGMQWAVESDADVISLSLGSEDPEPALIPAVQNAHAAGTVVVAATGNQGEGTSSTPGDVYDAVAVGAVDFDGDVARFSSGETIDATDRWGENASAHWPDSYIVPDVVAPGVDIYSASPGADYRTTSGTSMATPHVSGSLALAQAATDRTLTPAELFDALVAESNHPDGTEARPDARYGAGIIDALATVDRVSTQATVTGTVTDTVTGEPIANATVILEAEGGDRIELQTNESGTFERLGLTGDREYDVRVEAPGYDREQSVVYVPADETIDLEVPLAGAGRIDLHLLDDTFDAGVPDASVTVSGPRGSYPVTDEGAGHYVAAQLPALGTYNLSVTADGFEPFVANHSVTDNERVDVSHSITGNATLSVDAVDAVTDTPIEADTVTLTRADGTTATIESPVEDVSVPGTGATHTLTVESSGYLSGEDTVVLGNEAVEVRTVRLAGDSTIEISLTETVFTESVEGATVTVSGPNGAYHVLEYGDGAYAATRIPSIGSYDVSVIAAGYDTAEDTVSVTDAGVTTSELSLAADAAVALTVVEREEGTSVENASVTVERLDGATYSPTNRTDANGSLLIELPGAAATYELTIDADEYISTSVDTPPVRSGMTTDVTAELDPVSDGLPGFGAVAALLAFFAAVGLRARRRN